MPATRKIQREPRSMDDIMASAERMIHNRVGTMPDASVRVPGVIVPVLEGATVRGALGGGVMSPLNNSKVGTYQGRNYDNTTY